MSAGATADPGETAGEHTTADVSVELALHQLRHHLASTCDDSREGGAVMTNRAMQWDVFDVASFPSLALVGGDFQITGNPSYPTCAAEALAAQVRAIGGIGLTTSISFNNEAASCP
jgi:hypothetical protein